MAKSAVSQSAWPVAVTATGAPASGLLSLIFIAVVVAVALYQLRLPAAVSSGAPVTEFSSGRALKHLQNIARDPRPIGSAGHTAAREYIVGELSGHGFATEVQTAAVTVPSRWPPFRAATVRNVLGRLKGSEAGGKAVLLVAHYDSVAQSRGAGDDGSGVAVLLETARALKAGGPLKNDVMLLLTDGEEIGLAGARAFVDQHPWAKDVGVVLNFEARGSGGQSLMFETSDDNKWLVQELSQAAPRPVANSLSYEIYKRLPNDTDLTVFKRAGFDALNFAFIEGIGRYHTPADTVENIDERSLQHHGSYALALARRFGAATYVRAREGNSVYFNLVGPTLIRYPASLVIPLAAAVLLAFAFVLFVGFRKRLLTLRGVIFGWLALLVSMVTTSALVWVSWVAIRSLHAGYESVPWGEPHNGGLYAVSFVALTVAVTAALYNWFRKKTSVYNLSAGALMWWMMLAAAVSVLMPGGSYLLTWPTLFMLVGLAVSFVWGERRPVWRVAVLLVCAVPGILLGTPLITQLFTALTLNAAAAVVVLVVLLLGLLVPHLELMSAPGRWTLPSAALLVFFGFALCGLLTAGFDRNHPKPNGIIYALDADTGKAVWASADAEPDEWTSQFFPAGASRGMLDNFFRTGRLFLTGEAPAAPLAAPAIALLSDEIKDGVRTLRMRVTSPRRAPLISLYTGEGSEVVGALVDGRAIPGADAANWAEAGLPWGMHYHALPEEGVELVLRLKPGQPLKIQAVDRTHDFRELTGASFRPRPEDMMPVSSAYGDSAFVTKSFTF